MVVDTSAWIEWFLNSPTGVLVRQHFPNRAELIVPTIVQLELAKWIKREVGDAEAKSVIALTQKCIVVPLTAEIALAAADLCNKYKLATADAVIYASALDIDAGLLTCDAHFAALPSVTYIRKALS
jgi:uncharacterized protein